MKNKEDVIALKIIKKRIILLLIFTLTLSHLSFAEDTSTEAVLPDITTDGSNACLPWFQVFDNLLTDKKTNGVKFFLILTSLRSGSLESQIESVLSRNSDTKNLLSRYGLNANSIHFLMNYYMSTFPENIDDVVYNYTQGENIYADLYHNSDFKYSEYMVRFHNYLNDLYQQLPQEMKNIIVKYDRNKAGEIIVMQNLMNIIIKDYIAFEVYNSSTSDLVSRDIRLRNEIRQPLVDKLTEFANSYPDNYEGDKSVDMDEINTFVDTIMALGNVMLDSIELNLQIASSNGNPKLMDYGFELLNGANLLVRTPYTTSQPVVEVTLEMNTDLVELDSSVPLTQGYINQFQLIPTVKNGPNIVAYTSSDPNLVKVDNNGLITLGNLKRGSALVTATVKGYNVFKEISIQVDEQTPLGGVKFYGAYISGFPDGEFKSTKKVTRAEIATMMVRVLQFDLKNGLPIPIYEYGIPTFEDVGGDHWAYRFIEIAVENKIMAGYDDKTFRPNDPVTRAEMAVIISNAWEALDIEKTEVSNHLIIDVERDHWAFDAINKLYNAKVVSGYDDGTYRPDVNTSRGEIVVMINKIIEREENKPDKGQFSDISNDHWAYGHIEAATRIQVRTDNIPNQE